MEVGSRSGAAVPLPPTGVQARPCVYASFPSLAASSSSWHDSIINRYINKYILKY
jgi:hypothetical protein